MSTNFTPVISRPDQVYFSNNFLIQLRFHGNSLVNGRVVHYPVGLNSAEKFTGIFMEEDSMLKLSFFIKWNNPNVSRKILTGYSGEITHYEGERSCLRLDWLQVNECKLQLSSFTHRGTEILCQPGRKGLIDETIEPRLFGITKGARHYFEDFFDANYKSLS